MIAVIDYGVGNLFSLCSSLKYVGADCILTREPAEIMRADGVILPGVGGFGAAAAKLRALNLEQAVLDVAENGKPLFGICLGMQLLFEKSEEYGEHKGLGLIRGEIKSLAAALSETPEFKVPHIGWNSLNILRDCPILKNTTEGDCVYYVHSFYAPSGANTVASSDYGTAHISGVVWRGNVFGTQFHPEKSGKAGLGILKAFVEVSNGNLSGN